MNHVAALTAWRQCVKGFGEFDIGLQRVALEALGPYKGAVVALEPSTGQVLALAGCDLLTISPELLAQLMALQQPVTRALDPAQARALDLPELRFDEAGFRFALNEDAMATEKLAEGIRAFVVDARKLEDLMKAV